MELILSKISHPSSAIRHPSSDIRHPSSAIRHPSSDIRHPSSAIRHPPSDILHPSSDIRHPISVKNLLFDFGGVICNIDVRITERRFIELGWRKEVDPARDAGAVRLFEGIETGVVSPQEFRDGLKQYFTRPVTDAQLDDAWNALLLDIPEPAIRLLEQLRERYRIFMLTNTNAIHYPVYRDRFAERYGYGDFDDLFEKAYYSYRIGLKKPDPAIFRHVLAGSGLDPAATLFIDDTLVHVESAQSLGMHAHHLQIGKGEEIMDLFFLK